MNHHPCLSCDTANPLTPQGVCGSCQDDLRFVTRPVAHREMYRREVAGQTHLRQEWEQRGVVIITSTPASNDLWICDLCNAVIPVAAEHTLIPLIGSYALCGTCVTGYPYWPDAWTHPTPRACRCDACQTPLRNLTPRNPPTPTRNQPQRNLGHER